MLLGFVVSSSFQMDVGVGSFVFSQGVVNGRKMGRGISFRVFVRSCLSVLPLLTLGFARLWFVKSTGYQEHVSEYGVHWNFFFTLAFIPPFSCIPQILNGLDAGIVGLFIICAYQASLSFFGLENYILHAERVDLLSQNKEGVFSFFGFMAIFFFAVRFGQMIFDSRTVREWQRKIMPRSIACSVALWALYFALSIWFPTSRRLANFMYVLCVLAHNLLMISLCLLLELIFPTRDAPPKLMVAINRNQLGVFLVANVMTGLINNLMYTLFAEKLVAFLIILVYMVVVCAFALVLNSLDITL
eukprot:Partr_v1_DN26348_c0_g3_i2_m43336 putative Phosphatidylinositol glycan anchor biosynthesis, class W